MSSADKSGPLHDLAKVGSPWWRSSLYDEPVWVSVAWIIGPTLVAALAMYLAVR
ncbi:MAG TPA: hypothetical protein VJU61_05560 [Polyangiaceae bacterium]|nr:hypothetical protein [Polyangiaceae bacterium]